MLSRFLLLSGILLLISCSSAKLPVPSSKVSGEISAGVLGNWEQLGIQKGQPVPDFTLFSEDGRSFRLSSELKKGRPVVLISGSYTCDVSRSNMQAIKDFQKRFGKRAKFFMVYTIDAHPYDTGSPYSPEGKIWIAKNNVRDNIKAAQPRTYQQRVDLARQWVHANSIAFPVLIDTPDNFYWKKFGQAPNMVYIISPAQEVQYKQAWFNKRKTCATTGVIERGPWAVTRSVARHENFGVVNDYEGPRESPIADICKVEFQ